MQEMYGYVCHFDAICDPFANMFFSIFDELQHVKSSYLKYTQGWNQIIWLQHPPYRMCSTCVVHTTEFSGRNLNRKNLSHCLKGSHNLQTSWSSNATLAQWATKPMVGWQCLHAYWSGSQGKLGSWVHGLIPCKSSVETSIAESTCSNVSQPV